MNSLDSIVSYFIHSTLSFTILFVAYKIFLNRSKYFKINRILLLLIAAFSLLMPLLPSPNSLIGLNSDAFVLLDPIDIGIGNNTAQELSPTPLIHIISYAYTIISSLLLLFFCLRLIKILRLNHNLPEKNIDGIKVKSLSNEFASFSFLRTIYLNTKDHSENELNYIFEHEKAHINQRHSYDKIFIELLIIFFWFNPFIWAYKKELEAQHEYLADDAVLRNNDLLKENYYRLILSQVIGIPINNLINGFNHSLIKKRLIMMKMSKTTKWISARVLLFIPVFYLSMIVYSGSDVNYQADSQDSNPLTSLTTTPSMTDDTTVFHIVEEMPQYSNGGDEGVQKFIATNVQYPEKMRKKGIEGKVYVEFIVNTLGNVEDVKVIKSKAYKTKKNGEIKEYETDLFDAEAIRVVKKLATFSPGKQKGKAVKVKFVLPINFKLS